MVEHSPPLPSDRAVNRQRTPEETMDGCRRADNVHHDGVSQEQRCWWSQHSEQFSKNNEALFTLFPLIYLNMTFRH